MKYSASVFFILLLTIVSCSSSKGPSVVQVPQRAPVVPDVVLQQVYFADNDSLHLFLLLEDRRSVIELEKAATHLTYEVRSGRNTRSDLLLKDTVLLGRSRVVDIEGGLYTNIALPKDVVRSPNRVQVQLWQQLSGKEERIGSLLQVPLTTAMLEKRSLLVDANTNRPLIRGYVTTTDKVKIISASDTGYVKVELVAAEFAPALPPMSTRTDQQSRTLQVTDSLTIKPGDVVQFEKEGLYLIWAGEAYAQGLLVQPWSFPDVTMARELVAPLIYLTTSQEREKLHNAPDPKRAVDAFWQDVAGNTENARQMIRLFYGRVETANKLFTSHKAGWATDRGMIYIIFGKPDEINRVGPDETWVYTQTRTQPYIKFVFTKKQNNFTGNHYELVRLRDYQEVWYSTVAKWRAGITDM